MARRDIGAVDSSATNVVHLFPDYAESVIWLRTPIPYEMTRLDAWLVEALKSWDQSYYAGLTPDLSWRSPGLQAEFLAEGARLARRLADQIGDEFQVQHQLPDGLHRRVRGSGPARNPDAAAAFRRLAEPWSDEEEGPSFTVDQADESGHILEWRA